MAIPSSAIAAAIGYAIQQPVGIDIGKVAVRLSSKAENAGGLTITIIVGRPAPPQCVTGSRSYPLRTRCPRATGPIPG